MAPKVPLVVKNPAVNAQGVGIPGGRTGQPPLTLAAFNPIQTNPMFGRPTWTYTQVIPGPVRGPQPRLAQGSGQTGPSSLPGNASSLPGYLSDNNYEPTLFTYDSVDRQNFLQPIPKSIPTAQDGRDIVGTYQPHKFTPATRNFNHMRSAANWQVMEYPPNYRNLIAWQQVQRYRVNSFTAQARPLAQSDYFVGYQINPNIAANIGQSTLGTMGSM